MLDIPFPIETLPVQDADHALQRLTRERRNSVPVLLGDIDVFSTEWAESVDIFEPPERVLEDAARIDTERWFGDRAGQPARTASQMGSRNGSRLLHMAALPVSALLQPLRLGWGMASGRRTSMLSSHSFGSQGPAPGETDCVRMLRAHVRELEASGESTAEEIKDINDIIEALAADGTSLFPDPVAYVTPRRGDSMAAALVDAREPWEAAAWLQHGTYAFCAPKPVLVAHCKWLWQTHGGRIITASTDHIGFQMDRPINSTAGARDVLGRFAALGATEVNADRRGTDGSSLIGAPRLWVWWD